MVLSASQKEREKKSSKSFFIGYLIFCIIFGLIIGFCFWDWFVGVLAGTVVLVIGMFCLLLSVFFGLICIPPMILIDKLTGDQKANKEIEEQPSSDSASPDAKPKEQQ